MDKIAEMIATLFKELKPSFRWVAVFIFLGLAILGFWFFERSTGQLYFSRLERKITLLTELQKLKDSGIENNPELYNIYQDLVVELESFSVEQPAIVSIKPVDFSEPAAIGKAISGAFLWVLILVFGVSYEIRKAGKITGTTTAIAVFLLVVSLLFAWFGMIIPTIINPWVNFIGFPIVQIIILVILTRKSIKPVAPKQQA